MKKLALLMVGMTLAVSAVPMAEAATLHPARAHQAFGPPLGYYAAAVRYCQRHPWNYYHQRDFYRACRQAAAIVSSTGSRCNALAVLGILVSAFSTATGQWQWATLVGVSGMTIACLKG